MAALRQRMLEDLQIRHCTRAMSRHWLSGLARLRTRPAHSGCDSTPIASLRLSSMNPIGSAGDSVSRSPTSALRGRHRLNPFIIGSYPAFESRPSHPERTKTWSPAHVRLQALHQLCVQKVTQ